MHEWQAILLVVLVSMIGAVASLFQKLGSAKLVLQKRRPWAFIRSLINPQVVIGLLLYVIATSLFVIALRFHNVSVLYPLTSLTYVWIAVLSILILKEQMNTYKWGGILLVLAGVVLISL